MQPNKLYFFDKDTKPRIKRSRKPVDQLPFNIACTAVSGSLKVEDYLREQNKDEEPLPVEKSELADGNQIDFDPTKVLQNGVGEQLPIFRNEKLFPTSSGDIEVEEDTQRFLFEENKFAAPNLLAHLGRILEILHEKHLECSSSSSSSSPRFRERAQTNDNWANLTTSYNCYHDISSSNFNLRSLGIFIPFHLAEKLRWNLEQLTVNTVYTKRQWQTNSYKQQEAVTKQEYSVQQVMKKVQDVKEAKATGDVNEQDEKVESSSFKKSLKNVQERTSREVYEQNLNSDTLASSSMSNKHNRKLLKQQKPKPSIDVSLCEDTDKMEENDDNKETIERRVIDSLMPVNNEQIPNSPPKSILGFRRESLKDITIEKLPRTRLEKYKYIPDKSSLVQHWKRKANIEDNSDESERDHEGHRSESVTKVADKIKIGFERELTSSHKISTKEYEVPNAHQIHGNLIAFSLMSKYCEDKGWVHHANPDEDLERLTVIEWARSRLRQAINEINSEYSLTKNGSKLLIKQYGGMNNVETDKVAKLWMAEGENSLVSITKFIKYLPKENDTFLQEPKMNRSPSVIWKEYNESLIQKIKKKNRFQRTCSETAKIDLFVISLPDDTVNVYYPNGKIAICTARNVNGEGKYTYVYGTDNESLLAYFTPSHGFCREQNNKLFLCSSKEATTYSKECDIMEHWKWKEMKKKSIITYELNEFITLRIGGRNQMYLHFSARSEMFKINVSILQDAKSFPVNSTDEMMTTGDYTSDIAQKLTVVKTNKSPRTKREEKRAKTQMKKASHHIIGEESQEQRREHLEKMFPERKKLALHLTSDVDLYKMKRRIKSLVYDWMQSYRLMAGMASPLKIPDKKPNRLLSMSAKSCPGKMPSTSGSMKAPRKFKMSISHRVPSAPPIERDTKVTLLPLDKLVNSVEEYLGNEKSTCHESSINHVYLTEMDRKRILANQSGQKLPFRCGMTSYDNRNSSLKEGCPVALRSMMLGDKYPCCRCRKREIPFVSDIAYDKFIKEGVPNTQLLVISIVSSRNPSISQCTIMLEQLYYEKNRNRSFPCAQSLNDPFRIVLYNVDTLIEQSLLVRRHNVVPGMFLMYIGGKLLFADHIFNGYGNARKDFLKQISKSRRDYLQGLVLPSDFQFNPTPCRSGPRSAWGGEIGGLSMSSCSASHLDITSSIRLHSPATTYSSSGSPVLRASGAKSVASFVNLGLSLHTPGQFKPIKKQSSSSLLPRTAPAKSRA